MISYDFHFFFFLQTIIVPPIVSPSISNRTEPDRPEPSSSLTGSQCPLPNAEEERQMEEERHREEELPRSIRRPEQPPQQQQQQPTQPTQPISVIPPSSTIIPSSQLVQELVPLSSARGPSTPISSLTPSQPAAEKA